MGTAARCFVTSGANDLIKLLEDQIRNDSRNTQIHTDTLTHRERECQQEMQTRAYPHTSQPAPALTQLQVRNELVEIDDHAAQAIALVGQLLLLRVIHVELHREQSNNQRSAISREEYKCRLSGKQVESMSSTKCPEP